MGTVYIFRGKAATGKSTLANMLAKKLSIPVFCKDDVVDSLKNSKSITNQSFKSIEKSFLEIDRIIRSYQ